MDKSGETEKNTETNDTKTTLETNKSEEDTPLSFTVLDINKLSSVYVKSDSLSKTFIHAADPEPIKKICSYLNELDLQSTMEEPAEEPAVIIKASYLYTSSTKNITIYLFESGKKIGVSNLYNEKIMNSYDVVGTNARKPLDFLDSFYTPIVVTDGRLDFADKEVSSFSLVYYVMLPIAEHSDELKFKDSEKLKQIMTFFKNVELGEPVKSSDLNENHPTGYLRFYFEDGSFSEIIFQYSYYLITDGKYYDMGDAQREELYEILSTPLWR